MTTATIHSFTARHEAQYALAAAEGFDWGQRARITRDPDNHYWLVNVVDGTGQQTAISATRDAIAEFINLRTAQALGRVLANKRPASVILWDEGGEE